MNHTPNDLLALKKTVDEALQANRSLQNKIAKQKTDSVLQNRIAVLGRWSTYRKLLSK